MTDLAREVGVYDPLARQREALARAKRRADNAAALCWGALFAALFFVAWIGVTA